MNEDLIRSAVINAVITNENLKEMIKHFKEGTIPCRYLNMKDIIFEIKMFIFEEFKNRFSELSEDEEEMTLAIRQAFEYIKNENLLSLIKILDFEEKTIIAKVVNNNKFWSSLKKFKEKQNACYKVELYIILNDAVKEKTTKMINEINNVFSFTKSYDLNFEIYNYIMHKCFGFLCKETLHYNESINIL